MALPETVWRWVWLGKENKERKSLGQVGKNSKLRIWEILELHGKALLLKTPHTFITGQDRIKLVPTRKIPHSSPARMVLESAIQTAGEKSPIVLPYLWTCKLQQWPVFLDTPIDATVAWMLVGDNQSPSDWMPGLLYRRKCMSGTLNLVKNLEFETSQILAAYLSLLFWQLDVV